MIEAPVHYYLPPAGHTTASRSPFRRKRVPPAGPGGTWPEGWPLGGWADQRFSFFIFWWTHLLREPQAPGARTLARETHSGQDAECAIT
jgi:hypothetical protein